MKTIAVFALFVTLLSLPTAFAQTTANAGVVKAASSAVSSKTDGCAKCAVAGDPAFRVLCGGWSYYADLR